VDEAEDEFFGGLVDEGLLPRLQRDCAGVLLAGAVLWEQARPVLGAHVHLDAALALRRASLFTWDDSSDRFAAALDDGRVLLIEDDS
jgi:hypothetical protein